MRSFIVGIIGTLTGIFVMIKCMFVISVRLSGIQGLVLLAIIDRGARALVFSKEITDRPLPRIYTAFVWLGFPVYVNISERLLRAGYESFDTPITVSVPRWNLKKFVELIRENTQEPDKLPVYILRPWDAEQIGAIPLTDDIVLYVDEEVHTEIEVAVKRFMTGGNRSFGMILYGPPGTGKSYFVRYLAIKYKLPIYIVSPTADMDNHQLIRMFAHITGPAIVLFEDFDSYFDGKKCLLPEAKFTFDTLLNIFDGVFSSDGDIIRILTANDIEKVDVSLKMRPSRFRLVKEMAYPTVSTRERIFGDSDLVERTDGLNLDQMLTIKQMLDEGSSFEDITSKTLFLGEERGSKSGIS